MRPGGMRLRLEALRDRGWSVSALAREPRLSWLGALRERRMAGAPSIAVGAVALPIRRPATTTGASARAVVIAPSAAPARAVTPRPAG